MIILWEFSPRQAVFPKKTWNPFLGRLALGGEPIGWQGCRPQGCGCAGECRRECLTSVQDDEKPDVVEATVAAIRSLLRPLATAMIKVGLTFPMFNNLAREAFVEAAREDFAVDGEATQPEPNRDLERRPSKGGQAARRARPGSARTALRFAAQRQGGRGLERRSGLSRRRPSAARPAAHRRGRRPRPSNGWSGRSAGTCVRRALLDEWLRQGWRRSRVTSSACLRPAFLPTDGYREKAYFFGRNLRDHIARGRA